jgi:hypothetical protein
MIELPAETRLTIARYLTTGKSKRRADGGWVHRNYLAR